MKQKRGRKYLNCSIKVLLFFACILLFAAGTFSQTFSAPGRKLYDYYGYYYRQAFRIEVSGLPLKADTSFGLEMACITIHHNRVSDLKITLESPDGTSIWLTTRNGGDTGRNYIQTCFSQSGSDGYIHLARAPFTGTYQPDGQLEFLNHGENPNGSWIIYVEDLMKEEAGVVDSVSLRFGNQPARTVISRGCGTGDYSMCRCANQDTTCDLLPDLVILPFFTEHHYEEYAYDDKYYPGQLRFAATIANLGFGPMEVVGTRQWVCGMTHMDSGFICPDGTEVRQLVQQRVYSKTGDSISARLVNAGTMYYDNHTGHNHYHVDNWVAFRLVDSTGGQRKVIATGNKVSYCLFTTGSCYEGDGVCTFQGKTFGQTMPNYGMGVYPSCNFDKQGISVGGYDTYGLMYEGQYLQLPRGLKNGEYWLEIEVDPDHRYLESDIANNIFSMKVNLKKQQP